MMQNDRQLRLLVQATGLYFMAHSVFNLLTTVTRITLYKVFPPSNSGFFVTGELRPVLFQGLIYAALLLIPGWLLLAKADWFTRAISDMSKPRDEYEDEDSPVS